MVKFSTQEGITRLRVVICVCFLLMLLTGSLILPAIPVHAASNGTITGRVINSTSSDNPVQGATVKLYSAHGQQNLPTRTVKTDQNGTFKFTGLHTGKQYSYLVSAKYKGVQYDTGRLQLADGNQSKQVNLKVFNTTKDDSMLRVRSVSMAVLATDKSSQSMFVVETFEFDNPTKRTFVPSTDGPKGPMGLLRFSLPPNSKSLSPLNDLASYQVIQTDKGFATNMPIKPGNTTVAFSYNVPYRTTTGAYSFSLAMPYPTKSFSLLLPRNGLHVDSTNLRSAGTKTLGGTAFDVYRSGSLQAQSSVNVDLSGLPFNVWFLRPDNRWLWLGSGVLLALLLLTAFIVLRRGKKVAGQPDDLGPERDTLVKAIARLDGWYEAGEMDEQVYRRERELYKQQLMAVMAGKTA